jgi:hypothetical protein
LTIGVLKPKRVHVRDYINATIAALWGDARSVAHALHKMRHKVLELVACELCHKPLNDEVAGVGLCL